MNNEQLLNDLYYKQMNFDGVNNLYLKAKKFSKDITQNEVKEWLNKQSTHQETNKTVKKKIYLPIYSETPFSFQIDLTFFPRYTKKNDGYSVLFTAININTRYAYAYYSKTKEMNTILEMMKKFKENAIEINSITTDEGTEFTNNKFIKYCNEQEIEIYFVKGDSHKLGIINRFHRTIKDKLLKYFTASDNVRWIDIIDKIIYNYNHTINTGIGIEPYKVNRFIETEIIADKKNRTEEINDKNLSLNIGDRCRLKKKEVLFEDKMTTKYSKTIYTITKIFKNTVEIKHNEDIKTVKKSDIMIIKDSVEHIAPDIVQMAVQKDTKTRNKLKKIDVQENNIIDEPRVRKPKQFF